jgi:hypothetical protein
LIGFEDSSGEPYGILCYAFLANAKPTQNRPADEHRFQVKYGSDTKASLAIFQDPLRLVTTLFVGIDPQREILVGADPALHDGTPMFVSVEFKEQHIRRITDQGWFAWKREKRGRERMEVLVGVTKRRLLDYVKFERAARGLSQSRRAVLAQSLLVS